MSQPWPDRALWGIKILKHLTVIHLTACRRDNDISLGNLLKVGVTWTLLNQLWSH